MIAIPLLGAMGMKASPRRDFCWEGDGCLLINEQGTLRRHSGEWWYASAQTDHLSWWQPLWFDLKAATSDFKKERGFS